MLHFSTHYKGIIALDDSTRTRLRAKNSLRFEGTESGFKSEITVLDKPPPPPVAPKPPPQPHRLSLDNFIELPLFNSPKIGKGDNEFGTGDDVSCRVTLEARLIIRNATTLVATVRMRAEEWDRHSHKPHHDFTTADGWSQEFRIPILEAKPNTRLLSIVGDSYWTVPPFEMGTRPLNVSVGDVGLVKSYHVVGDTSTSQDIGVGENHTGVKFTLNKIQVNVVDD